MPAGLQTPEAGQIHGAGQTLVAELLPVQDLGMRVMLYLLGLRITLHRNNLNSVTAIPSILVCKVSHGNCLRHCTSGTT